MPRKSEHKTESNLFKDRLGFVQLAHMAKIIAAESPQFDQKRFLAFVREGKLESLELKARVNLAADALHEALPKNYRKSVEILIAAAPKLSGFGNWALTSFIERHGLDHFEDSVWGMEILTRHGSAEFAIRPYMIRYTDAMLPVLHRWTKDENEHVRRLAAEGSRPRGVWMAHLERFKKDPTEVIKILEKLKADPSLYVRKAVANNLNDISKDNPEVAVEVARRWLADNQADTTWIVKRACRTLIKAGHQKTLNLFGADEAVGVELLSLTVKPKRVKVGGKAELRAELHSTAKKPLALIIDYVLDFPDAKGGQRSKVFKLAERKLESGKTLALSFTQSFLPITTRKYYPGDCRISLLINGRRTGEVKFRLIP